MIIVLKVLNPWLKGVVRGKQGLADFWNETLKFDCLEMQYFHLKPAILSLLSGSCMWRVWDMAQQSQSFCCATFGQFTRPVNPDMKKGSIHHILCSESHQQLSHLSPFLFHRTPQ